MKQTSSAIMQMMSGERGNIDELPLSNEYKKALDILVKKIKNFEKQLADHPQLLEQFNEVQAANLEECAIFAKEVYQEAFAFGLAMGQEVFGK